MSQGARIDGVLRRVGRTSADARIDGVRVWRGTTSAVAHAPMLRMHRMARIAVQGMAVQAALVRGSGQAGLRKLMACTNDEFSCVVTMPIRRMAPIRQIDVAKPKTN